MLDEAFLGGIAVYETLRTYNGHIWQLNKHLDRLSRSAEGLEINLPYSLAEIGEMIGETLQRCAFAEARVRVTVTAGSSQNYGGSVSPSLVIIVHELRELPLKEAGVLVTLFNAERVLPEVKSCNLLIAHLAGKAAKKTGAFEALLVNFRGEITEGAISNVFFVKAGILITPNENILSGTTRELIIELARSAGISVEERVVLNDELNAIHECFICNAIRGIVPVKEICDSERKKISFNVGDGVTGRIKQLFIDHINFFAKDF